MSNEISTKLANQTEVADAIQMLEAWIESHLAYRNIPGLSLGIVYDQELIWARGFGYADVGKQSLAASGTLYRIASNTKMFTSVAILQLRDAGKLRLDDPVERHLPWFSLKGQKPDESPVTLRHLLTHTGGLPREAAFLYFSDFRFPTREQIQETVPDQERAYPPDNKWKYSNLGMALLGLVIEAVSGELYADYIHRHILKPLEMETAHIGVPDALRPRLATGYGRRTPDGTRALRPFTDAAGLDAAAGMTASVEDLAKFAALQFRDGPAGGAQVLKGATLREMHRVHWLSPDWQSGMGLGFKVIRQGSRALVGHGGWVAGYQTSFMTCPDEKIAVIALTNADDGAPYPGAPFSVVDRVFQWVAPAITKANAPAPAKPERTQEWEPFLGRYTNPWSDMQVLILDGKLTMIAPTLPDPTGVKLTLVPVGPNTFRTQSGAASMEDGDIVTFDLHGEKGVTLRIGAFESVRVESWNPAWNIVENSQAEL